MKKYFSTFLNSLWKKKEGILILFLIAFNCIVVFRTIPPSRLLDNKPFFRLDYARHFYNAYAISNILSQDKSLWGYDPYFAAGYSVGSLESLNNRATELFVFLLSSQGISKALSFKLFIIIIFLIYPLIIYLTAKNFAFSKKERILATALAIIFWYWQIPNFVRFGMFSFLTASFLYLYIFSLFYRYIKFKHWKDFSLMTIFSSLILLIHIFSFFCLIVPLVVLYLINIKKLSYRFHLSIILFIVIIFAINILSIYPVFNSIDFISTKFQNVFSRLGVLKLIEDFFINSKKLTCNIIMVLGIMGLLLWRKIKEKDIYLTFSATFIFIFALTYFGKYNNLFQLIGPYRYYHPLIFLLLFPASSSLIYLVQHLKNNFSKNKASFIFFVLIFLLAPFILKPLHIIIKPEIYFHDSLPEDGFRLINWIKDNTDTNGRILIEGDDKGANKFFKSHLDSLLPIFCQREFIGGPYYTHTNRYLFANFNDSQLFFRPITSFSPQELKYIFKTYNIIWIISWSKDSIKCFNSLEGFVNKINQIGNFYIYKVNQAPSFFLKGTGKVKVYYNRIWIKDASKGEVIIKYHWHPSLKTDPPLPIEYHQIKNDYIGCIKVKNGKYSSFLIYNSYQ